MMTLDQTGAHGVATYRASDYSAGDYTEDERAENLVAFDTTQITSKANYSHPKPGDPCHPLAAGAHPPSVAPVAFQQNQRDEVRTMDVAGALQSEAGMKQQNYLTTAIPRRLTPVECCRLQGFPDDWNEWGVDEDGERVEISDSARYRQMGNAVTVNVAHWIGQRLMDCHEEDR